MSDLVATLKSPTHFGFLDFAPIARTTCAYSGFSLFSMIVGLQRLARLLSRCGWHLRLDIPKAEKQECPGKADLDTAVPVFHVLFPADQLCITIRLERREWV